MQLLQLLLDKFISWPVVAVIAIIAFRRALIALLGREKVKVGVGKEGFTLDASTAAIIQSESKTVTVGLQEPEPVNKLLQAPRSIDVPPIVREQGDLIRSDLKRYGVSRKYRLSFLLNISPSRNCCFGQR